MPATNVKILNPADKARLAAHAIGTGAPALTDELITDTQKYPVGSTYLDTTNKVIYYRVAAAGNALADWYVEALTAHA